jgi:stage II sporulation protein D
MKNSFTSQLKYYFVGLLSLFLLGGQPVKFAQDKTFFHGYLIQRPIIRIGLGVNLSDIHVSASSGMKIYEVNKNYKLISDYTDEVIVKGHKEKLTEKFVIQVYTTDDRTEAEKVAQELKQKINDKVYVTSAVDEKIEGVFQVRVGDFITRGDALSGIMRLLKIGYKDNWIITEEITDHESKPLWILVNDRLQSLNPSTDLYIIPDSPQSFLSYKGRDYRGLFILHASRRGVVLVNVLNLEDYLKAVVPSEFSPYLYRTIEAHKAQAVAARTYAIKNLNKYDDLGYDLCDTPASQFYKGMNAEQPLSTKAVEMTQGEVATYKGKLIDALYTSTCGGMTENVENVFQGPALAYLRSTECTYEKQKKWTIQAPNTMIPVYLRGKNISAEVISLVSLGIIPKYLDPVIYRKEVSKEDILVSLLKVRELLGLEKKTIDHEITAVDYSSLAELIVDVLSWEERVKNLLLNSEVSFLLDGFGKETAFTEKEKNALAYLIQAKIFPPAAEMGDPRQSLTWGDLVFCLWGIIDASHDLIHTGNFKSLEERIIEIEEEEKSLTLASDFFLAKNLKGDPAFVTQLTLLGGEDIRWLERDGKIRMLEVMSPVLSNTLDRSSFFNSWQSRISREDLQKNINRYYPVGKLIDIKPVKRGDSKRVIELDIIGQEGQVTVKGLHIRRVLGLKETLFVIDREYDEEGGITNFIFTGRGWGHGVGLCQVGAYGMAQSGADYQEILKKYYQGIKIAKIY